MPASTPIARSKSAALARILDSIPKGYLRHTSGTVSASKAIALAKKFHERYGIAASPAKRITRKNAGLANALLVMFWPENAEKVEWLMLVTNGKGFENEQLQDITSKPRLIWLGYEFVRRSERGRTAWTCRRPQSEMTEHYALLASLCSTHKHAAVEALLQRLANQPGYHGVREQTWRLGQEAIRRGYQGELPFLFFMQKISHGDRLVID